MALAAHRAARHLSRDSFLVTFRARMRNKQPNKSPWLYLSSAGATFVMPALAIKLSAAALAPSGIVVLGASIVD